MSAKLRCKRIKGARTLIEQLFTAPYCDEVATHLTPLGTPVCEGCGKEAQEAYARGESVASLIWPEAETFRLRPIQ